VPQGVRLVLQGFPMQAKLCTARAIKRAELCGPMAHSELGDGHRGEICGVAFPWAGVRQAQAAVAQWEGELVRRGAVQAGLRHDGKSAVYRFARGAHHSRANVLPALGQVRNALLEAAAKDEPVVPVPQGLCQELVHQMAGLCGIYFGVCGLESGGANGGSGCWQALGCMPHSKLARNGSGGGVVPRMDSTLGGLRMEADGGCEGREHFCAMPKFCCG
jgi:hypothetical protein